MQEAGLRFQPAELRFGLRRAEVDIEHAPGSHLATEVESGKNDRLHRFQEELGLWEFVKAAESSSALIPPHFRISRTAHPAMSA